MPTFGKKYSNTVDNLDIELYHFKNVVFQSAYKKQSRAKRDSQGMIYEEQTEANVLEKHHNGGDEDYNEGLISPTKKYKLY